jgi:hypothetical protein
MQLAAGAVDEAFPRDRVGALKRADWQDRYGPTTWPEAT